MARPIIRPASPRKPIGLALQGGGSWGAYTWGVERLHTEGVAAGRQFIARHGDDIGVRETLDVGGVFVDSPKPEPQMRASNPRLDVDTTALSHAV